jgi:hypothetical protein
MNHKNAVAAVIVSTCLILLLWHFALTDKAPEPLIQQVSMLKLLEHKRASPDPSGSHQGDSSIRLEPRFFLSTNYPPVTPEERAMWEWWRAMAKGDPKFEWKRPIDFFGQVLDYQDLPIEGAGIRFHWNHAKGESWADATSDHTGKFQLRDQHGKVLTLSVEKEGYYPASGLIFEYAAFFDPSFHVPDSTRPVIVRLQKHGSTEPLIFRGATYNLPADSRVAYLHLETGKWSSSGGPNTISFQTFQSTPDAEGRFDYEVRISAPNGLHPHSDQLILQAPEAGYTPSIQISRLASDPGYRTVVEGLYYYKTGTGKYGSIGFSMTLRSEQEATIGYNYRFNPSGSRNLEYDPEKRINQDEYSRR